MKKLCLLLTGSLIIAFAGTGCQPKHMDDATINAKADSIYNARMVTVRDSMNRECETNMAAWVQMKADSIYKADSTAMAMMKK